MKILVIDEELGKTEHYDLEGTMDMPYTTNKKLTVQDFNTRNSNDFAWTTKKFLKDYEEFSSHFKRKIPVNAGFTRAWERVADGFLHHQLGTALDIGGGLNPIALNNIAKAAENSDLFDYVSQLDLIQRFIHLHQMKEAAGNLLPFETVKKGMVTVDVAVLQDAMKFIGYPVEEITGIFDQALENNIKRFQRRNDLVENGTADRNTWIKLYQKMFQTVPLV